MIPEFAHVADETASGFERRLPADVTDFFTEKSTIGTADQIDKLVALVLLMNRLAAEIPLVACGTRLETAG